MSLLIGLECFPRRNRCLWKSRVAASDFDPEVSHIEGIHIALMATLPQNRSGSLECQAASVIRTIGRIVTNANIPDAA